MPEDAVRRRKDDIYKVMAELAGIIVEEDALLWVHSRRQCVKWTRGHFTTLGLEDLVLGPTLTKLAEA